MKAVPYLVITLHDATVHQDVRNISRATTVSYPTTVWKLGDLLVKVCQSLRSSALYMGDGQVIDRDT